MTTLLLSLAVIIAALVWQATRVPIDHRWRRWQTRIICDVLCGRDRGQSPALIYARLHSMDAIAFEKMLLKNSGHCGHCVVRCRRNIGYGKIDGQMMIDGRAWLFQAERYTIAVRPERVETVTSLCAIPGILSLSVHTGRPSVSSRDIVTVYATVEILLGHQLPALITGGWLAVGGREL